MERKQTTNMYRAEKMFEQSIGRKWLVNTNFNKRSPEIGCITINEYVMQDYIDGGVELLMVFVRSR